MSDAAYLIAGFGLTWAALVGYAIRLARRTREASRVLKTGRPGDRGGTF